MRDYLRFPILVIVCALISALLATTAPQEAEAQTGTITGLVRADEGGTPLETVEVQLLRQDGGREGRTLTSSSGLFRFQGVPQGTYDLLFISPGWEDRTVQDVQVGTPGATGLEVLLTQMAFNLNPVQVTVGKREEKALEAPAAVEVVPTLDIAEQPAITLMEHVKKFASVDVIETGLQSSYVVVRGFNNVFSGATLTLTDNRIARVPSLRANIQHLNPTTNLDVERMEVVLGPGSALYGPNAANGVIHSLTKSPIDYPGVSVAVGNGVRQQKSTGPFDSSDEYVGHVEGRLAHQWADAFGVKLSGQWFQGTEYFFADPDEVEQQALAQACQARPGAYSPLKSECQNFAQGLDLREPSDVQTLRASVDNVAAGRNNDLERWALDLRADWRPNEDTEVILSGGRTNALSSVDLTGLGAAQVVDWAYNYLQGRARVGDAFAQVFWNKSDNTDSFLLQSGRPLVDESSLLVAQLQHSTRASESVNFIYGVDFLRTVPQTDSTINGQNEPDDDINEVGGYVQTEVDLGEKWDFVTAFRLDGHSRLDDPVFSPRAALVFSPDVKNTVRFTYNRAFSTPTTLNLFLDISGGTIPLGGGLTYDIRAQGTTEDGFTFSRTSGRPDFRSPFNGLPSRGGSPREFLPTTTAELWDLAVAVVEVQDAAAGALLRSLPVPTEEQVGIDLRSLQVEDRTFQPTPGGLDGIEAIPAVDPQITNTFEVGYKGFFAGSQVRFQANGYYTRISDFISALTVNSPNVFLNPQDVQAYLEGLGVPTANARALAENIGGDGASEPGIPLGVITPVESGGTAPALVLTYRNLGDLDLWGFDASVDVLLGENWELNLGGAWVSDDSFEAGAEDVPLNSATLKGSLGVRYRNEESGVSARVLGRAVNDFPGNSGVYRGPVAGHGVVDLTLGYRFPGYRSLTAQLDVKNVFDNSYQTFVGAPELGRFLLIRLIYEL